MLIFLSSKRSYLYDENIALLLNYDLYDSDLSEILADFEIVFSNGKSFEIEEEYICLQSENYKWVKGENKASIDFMGFEKEVVVTAFEITDFIKDVNQVFVVLFRTEPSRMSYDKAVVGSI